MTSFNLMALNIKLYWWLQNSYLLPNGYFSSVSQLMSLLHSEHSSDFLSLSEKVKALARAREALCVCPTFLICVLPLFTFFLFSSNMRVPLEHSLTLLLRRLFAPAVLCVFSSPVKWYMPSLASGPLLKYHLIGMPSLTTLYKGGFPFPFLLTLLYFSLRYLLPLCLFICLWSVLPSSMRTPLK